MKKRYYFAYFDINYLVRGLALIESLQKQEKTDYEFFIVCMDQAALDLLKQLSLDNVTLLSMDLVEAHDAQLLAAKQNRSKVAYFWTLKAAIALYLIEQHPHIDAIFYLDSDLYFFSPADPLWRSIEGHSIVLHEHRFSSDLSSSLQYGIYNAGMFGIRNDPTGIEILQWWRQKCLEWCHVRVEDGRFGDQTYLNDIPGQFERVNVIEDIGAGVAPWNHIQYAYDKDEQGRPLVNGEPIVFYHFHSLAFIEPDVVVPLKFPVNRITFEILHNCFLPYVDALLAAYECVRRVRPDFSSGMVTNGLLNESHTFIARRNQRDRIHASRVSQTRMTLDRQWDLYVSAQFILPAPENDRRHNANTAPGNASPGPQYDKTRKTDSTHLPDRNTKKLRQQLFDAYSSDLESKTKLISLCRYLLDGREWRAAEMLIVDFIKRVGPDRDVLNTLKCLEKPLFLNLGCGYRYHNDWINLDFTPTGPEVITHNLYKGIPFSDDTFDVVYHSHLLEHLPRQFAVTFILECGRVLKPGGLLRVVVPDLESTVREYIAVLDGALEDDSESCQRYDWMIVEMLDQLVRNRPGGEMLKYWMMNPMPAEDFVFQRMGPEVKRTVSKLRQHPVAEMAQQDPFLASACDNSSSAREQLAAYRASGEVHQWMYDRYSLTKLLAENGFTDIRTCKADESYIPNFTNYNLDTESDGSVRKPDSLFIEARIRKANERTPVHA